MGSGYADVNEITADFPTITVKTIRATEGLGGLTLNLTSLTKHMHYQDEI
jgi:hypothetical protein